MRALLHGPRTARTHGARVSQIQTVSATFATVSRKRQPGSFCHPEVCLGPDSNRHGVSPKGFSYHFSFRCCMFPSASHAFVVWTLPLPSRALAARGLGRGRQVST